MFVKAAGLPFNRYALSIIKMLKKWFMWVVRCLMLVSLKDMLLPIYSDG